VFENRRAVVAVEFVESTSPKTKCIEGPAYSDSSDRNGDWCRSLPTVVLHPTVTMRCLMRLSNKPQMLKDSGEPWR